METIDLGGRYGYHHKLEHIGGNLWQIKIDPASAGYYRLIGKEGDEKIGYHVHAFDPDGGPFLAVGSKIGDKTIVSITSTGIFELN